jgi:glycosyltransferase involved in cell wall biosynthesis
MKVSIFSAFYPFRGGIAQFNASLFRALEKDNHVKAFTFKNQYPNFLFPGTTQFVDENDTSDRIPATRIVSTFNPLTYFSASKKIKESQPDVFIANFWMSFFGVFLGVFARRLPNSTRKIAIIHNLIPHEPRFFDKWLIRYFLKRYDSFVVMSDAVRDDVLRFKPDAKFIQMNHPWYNHFGEKIDVAQAREQIGIDSNKKTLLFFGLIRDYKGLDLLLDAFNSLDDSYQLLIVGEVYSKLELYQQKIEQSPNKERIHFLNKYIQDSEVNLYFSAADLCVLPYRTATQSGITATSFHFDIPILATNVGGFKSQIESPGLGIVVDEPDAQLIRDGIEKYFNERLKEPFVEAIHVEKSKNTWDLFAQKLISFSKEVY